MMDYAIKLGVLAIPLLLALAPADAATKKPLNARAQASEPYHSETGPQATAVRTACTQLAAKRSESSDEFRSLMGPRRTIYSDCVRDKGYLP
jgi:hypothetical protein